MLLRFFFLIPRISVVSIIRNAKRAMLFPFTYEYCNASSAMTVMTLMQFHMYYSRVQMYAKLK